MSEFRAIEHIENPKELGTFGRSLQHIADNYSQEAPIVKLPNLTIEEFLQLVLILQEELDEEWISEKAQSCVHSLHKKLRTDWDLG